jgi:hypothetical protein
MRDRLALARRATTSHNAGASTAEYAGVGNSALPVEDRICPLVLCCKGVQFRAATAYFSDCVTPTGSKGFVQADQVSISVDDDSSGESPSVVVMKYGGMMAKANNRSM